MHSNAFLEVFLPFSPCSPATSFSPFPTHNRLHDVHIVTPSLFPHHLLFQDDTVARLRSGGWSFDDAHALAALISKNKYKPRRLKALALEAAMRLPTTAAQNIPGLTSPLSAAATATAAAASRSTMLPSGVPPVVIPPGGAAAPEPRSSTTSSPSSSSSSSSTTDTTTPTTVSAADAASAAPAASEPKISTDSDVAAASSASSSTLKNEPEPVGEPKVSSLTITLPSTTTSSSSSSLSSSSSSSSSSAAVSTPVTASLMKSAVVFESYYPSISLARTITPSASAAQTNPLFPRLASVNNLDGDGTLASSAAEFATTMDAAEDSLASPTQTYHHAHLVKEGHAARMRVDALAALVRGAKFVRVGLSKFKITHIRVSKDLKYLYWPALKSCDRILAGSLPPRQPRQSHQPSQPPSSTTSTSSSTLQQSPGSSTTSSLLSSSSSTLAPSPPSDVAVTSLADPPFDEFWDASDVCDSSDPRVRRLYRMMYRTPGDLDDVDKHYKRYRRIPIEAITGITTTTSASSRFQHLNGKIPLTYAFSIQYEFPEAIDEFTVQGPPARTISHTGTAAGAGNAGPFAPASASATGTRTGRASSYTDATPSSSTAITTTSALSTQPSSSSVRLRVIRKSLDLVALDGNEYAVWLKGLAAIRSKYDTNSHDLVGMLKSLILWATIERKWPSILYLVDAESGTSTERAFDALDVLNSASRDTGPAVVKSAVLRPVGRVRIQEDASSDIISRSCLELLLAQTPKKSMFCEWRPRFRLTRDGASTDLLFKRIADSPFVIFIVKDNKRTAFGGFSAVPWSSSRGGYFGNGDSFVFRVAADGKLEVYPWRGQVSYFQYTDPKGFGFGGGGGTAIHISTNFKDGRSQWSGTYQNPVLSGASDFTIYDFEAWVGHETD